MADKLRHVVRLDDDLSRRLEQLAPGQAKSALVADALRAWFRRESSLLTAPAVDPVLRTRLDQDSRRLSRIERDLQITLETLGLFIRYQLSVTAPLPAAEHAAARALGRLRFKRFIDRVGRQAATGRSLHAILLAKLEQAAAPETGPETGPQTAAAIGPDSGPADPDRDNAAAAAPGAGRHD